MKDFVHVFLFFCYSSYKCQYLFSFAVREDGGRFSLQMYVFSPCDGSQGQGSCFVLGFLLIFHIHMEMGGRGGTESHINLIWS